MPTDVALAQLRKAQGETQFSTDTMTIVCLWAVVGLVLAGLMCKFGFDAEAAQALLTTG
jgi:hypothetical protein